MCAYTPFWAKPLISGMKRLNKVALCPGQWHLPALGCGQLGAVAVVHFASCPSSVSGATAPAVPYLHHLWGANNT